jgi:hypothetical protein
MKLTQISSCPLIVIWKMTWISTKRTKTDCFCLLESDDVSSSISLRKIPSNVFGKFQRRNRNIIFWFLLWNLPKIPSNVFLKHFGYCSGIYRRFPATCSLNILVFALEFTEDSQQRVHLIFWFLLWNLPKIRSNVFIEYFGFCSGIYRRFPTTCSLNISVSTLEFTEDSH